MNIKNKNLYFKMKTNDEILIELAKKIKNLRLINNLNQEELAQRSGLSLQTIKNIEKNGSGSISSYVKLIRVLDRIDELDMILQPKIQTLSDLDKIEGVKRIKHGK